MSDVYDMDSFTLNIHGGYDENNVPVAGTTQEKTGFVERKIKIVVDMNGEDAISSANIFMEYSPGITLEDTVTLNGVNRNIIAIMTEKDFTNKRTRLYLQ